MVAAADRSIDREAGLARTGQMIAVVFFTLAAVTGFMSAARAAQPPRPVTVSVIDYAFTPPRIDVAPGGTVVFRNDGRALHRVVADDGGFDSHGLEPDHAWAVTVGAAGTIAYHCAIHPQMTGQLVVTASADPFVNGQGASTTTAVTATTAGPGSSTQQLASTGRESRALAFAAVLCLVLGVAALVLARPAPVRVVALGPRFTDDLLPARDRARRR